MRTALRTAVATALFAGLAVTPALAGTAFADDQKPASTGGTALSGPKTDDCTVTETIASVYPDWTVTLTNDAKKGPKAVLKDEKGKVLETVDRAHPGPTGLGQKITGAGTATPRYGQHTNGGDTAPYRWTDFPKLPKGCVTSTPPKSSGGTVLSGPTVHGCTATEVITSSYGHGWTVTLTNDAKKGPKAVLKEENGKVRATVDRAHPTNDGIGLKIKNANTATPLFGQNTNGGPTAPHQWTAFPKFPKNCGKTTGTPTTQPTTPATHAPQTGTQGGQTSVVPKGGVAAGAEFGTVAQSNDTALIASGAGAVVVVAGLGFAASRRRATTRG
ncbi:hypothetical protein ACFYU9_13845 [Streptomyces sp. NPDC004327]|uniref:hypothetical protein n=1 Tax=Streptomyces sp. NPDC004327 TaxID=3364699 RepID=UPI0036B401E3